MSVIRQPNVLGRTTQRRLVGVTAALSSATAETAAVGAWFVLVVVEARTLETAMAGLGILFCGALLRTGAFGVATSNLVDLLQPRRLLAAMVLTASWIVWLLIAERVGGQTGVAVAALSLALVLTGQFALERRVFHVTARSNDERRLGWIVSRIAGFVPGLIVAVGATALLATAWFADWSLRSVPFTLGETTVVFELPALYLGVLAFWLCSFLAQQRRLNRTLGS